MAGRAGTGLAVQCDALRPNDSAVEIEPQQRDQTVTGTAHPDLSGGRAADHRGVGKSRRHPPGHMASKVEIGRAEAEYEVGAEAGPLEAQRLEIRRRRSERPRPHRTGSPDSKAMI
ncbi:hypothetical protein SAE02_12980 [Skermanella aerolata]|uniref:Uncharacterized protein n=1 Tax=Skermanella aerolata TaxID=393310 RepID=A0A512DLV5_9PROT|nr:hypothetical protein SAE02_12980 [Skermanella aerolata]